MYVLKLEQEQFEGPFDLLLNLIEKRQLDITRLSLARIAEEYLAVMTEGRYATLEHMAGFLSIASRLLLLKSRSLLPFLILEPEEEESLDDLEWRLKEYKRYKEAALWLKTQWESGQRSFGREPKESAIRAAVNPVFSAPAMLTRQVVGQVFARIIESIQLPEVLEEGVIEEIISLEEKISTLRQWFTERIESSFAETVAAAENRMEVIVSFLAILELVKQKVLHADQEELFVDIRVRKR